MTEKGLEQIFNQPEKPEEKLEEAAVDQFGQFAQIIDELEKQSDYLEAQMDGTVDEDLAFKINDELPLPREQQEAWDDLLEGDYEALEISPVVKD